MDFQDGALKDLTYLTKSYFAGKINSYMSYSEYHDHDRYQPRGSTATPRLNYLYREAVIATRSVF